MFYPRTVREASFRTSWSFDQIADFFTTSAPEDGEYGFVPFNPFQENGFLREGFTSGGFFGHVIFDQIFYEWGSPLEVLVRDNEVIITTPTSCNIYTFRKDGRHIYSGSLAGFGDSSYFPEELNFELTSVREISKTSMTSMLGDLDAEGTEWRTVDNKAQIFNMLYKGMLSMDIWNARRVVSLVAFDHVSGASGIPEEIESQILAVVNHHPRWDETEDNRSVQEFLIEAGLLEEPEEEFLTIYCPGIG